MNYLCSNMQLYGDKEMKAFHQILSQHSDTLTTLKLISSAEFVFSDVDVEADEGFNCCFFLLSGEYS